ncbi:MAG TPA: hypothetical protein PKL83_05395 [bacterium]|nr:hypothetical protein [bacterium]
MEKHCSHIAFPECPVRSEYQGICYEQYIPEQLVRDQIVTLSAQVQVREYERVLYVLRGGLFLYEQLTRLQDIECNYEKHAIEYHRHPVSGDRLIEKAVPADVSGSVLVIDDVWDTARTARLIAEDLYRLPAVEQVTFAVVARKDSVPGRVGVPGVTVYAAMELENRWLGGCGMDLGVEGPNNRYFRNLPEIVVRPE